MFVCLKWMVCWDCHERIVRVRNGPGATSRTRVGFFLFNSAIQILRSCWPRVEEDFRQHGSSRYIWDTSSDLSRTCKQSGRSPTLAVSNFPPGRSIEMLTQLSLSIPLKDRETGFSYLSRRAARPGLPVAKGKKSQ